MRPLMFLLIVFLLSLPTLQADAAPQTSQAPRETVFDFKALTSTPLNARVLKTSEQDGIVTEEVMFHSEKDGDKDVEIFAFFSYPKGAQKLPAFVWNQAGLGQASIYWTELGARRGYAALCIDMPMPGYRSTGDYPIGMNFKPDTEPRANPIYHGAVALLKAVSYLESRPEVDKNRIGMAGSSWGGFYTTLMAGLDPRLKAGSAMFGTGNLQLGGAWWDGNGGNAIYDAAFREKWRTTLDPAYRLPQSKTAMAWFTGTNDHFFWLPSVMKSYEMAAGAKHLALLPNWNHGLTPVLDEQVFAWLDIHLQGKPSFLRVTPLKVLKEGKRLVAQWKFSGPRKIASAQLIVGYGEAGNWESRPWSTLPATIKDGVCSVELPASALPYYISGTATDADGYVSSTALLRVQPGQFGIRTTAGSLRYDGAQSWGEFEKEQITFLKGQGFANPTVSPDARQGEQSILFQPGRNTLRPLYFVPGLPHRLTVYLKADKATSVTVELSGRFDGKQDQVSKSFDIGTQWTPVMLQYSPPQAHAATLDVSFLAPEGVSIVADSLSFRPL